MAQGMFGKRRVRPGAPAKLKIHFKKNDIVKVIAGRDKGKSGRVLSVDRTRGTVLVEHVMMIKRHTRPNPSRQIKGGIAERESPIAVAKVLIVCPACHKAVRMALKEEAVGGKTRRTRVCRKCAAPLEKKA